MSYYAAGGWFSRAVHSVAHLAAPAVKGIKLNNQLAMQYARSWVGAKVGAAAQQYVPQGWKETINALPVTFGASGASSAPAQTAALMNSGEGTPGHRAHAASRRARGYRRVRRRGY